MIFNWKLETFRRLFGLKRSNKAVTKKLNIENLEERIECATKVWNGSLAGVGTDGSLSPFSYGTDGDPTFSTYMAAISGNNGLNQITNSLGDNWNAQFGQRALPNNGDTLVFPQLYLTINGNSASLITPINGVFGDLTRTDLDATVPTPPRNPPGPIFVNVINDLMPDSNGNLAGYLRDQVTGANFVNPLIYVDQILLSGTGYAIYGRDNPQFGPTNSKISPPHYFVGGETVSAEFFYPGAAASSNVFQDPYFKPSQWTGQVVYVDPATYNPLTNISYNPAIPLNIQTQIVADYLTTGLPANSTINFSNDSPIYPAIATGANPSNANWIYMPMNIGNPNLPEGSAFVFNVTQEGGWLILDSDLHETSTNNTDGNYTLLNDVNNNKILKQGRGILVFESNNQFTGLVSIQDGMVIVSDSEGLGSAFTNSNVEVFDGTLSLSSDQFGIGSIQATGQPNVQGDSYSTTNISNRNLILNGGDGFLPTLNSSTTPVGVPLGQFSGQSGIYGRAHQWNGTVALNTNPSEITQASLPGDQFGNDGTFSIGSIQVTSGGTGYDPLNPPVVQIQAPNSAFAGQAVLQDGGIASIPLLTGGSGYGIAPTVNITGDGTGATANATLTNGVVTAIVITNPGTGYTYAPSVSISAPGGAIAGTPVVTNGQITQIPIQNGGSGYVNSPVVIITDNPTQGTPAGTGATATAILTNGVVTSINITNPGTGYTNPTVTIGLVGAIAGTPVITNSQITQIPLNGNGFGYSSLPLISISGPGNGATALAVAGAVSGTPANPNGDPSVGQEFGSATEINGVISGAAGLRKWGMGVVEVTQANTFSGDVVIFDGALNIQNNLGLGVSNNIQNGVVVPKNVYVRELPSNLVPQNQLLSHMGALTLGDETNGGQNLVFDTGYQLIIQDGGNAGTTNATGPDQNPGSNSGLTNTSGARVEGLGAFQVVSPNDNPNSAEWQGNVVVQTNAAIGGTPNSNLKISGVISATGQANNLITLEKRGSMNLSVSANNADTSNVNGNFVGNWLISNGNLKVENNGALGFAGTNSNNSSYVWVRQQSQVLPGLSGAGSLQMVGDGLNISNNIVLESTGFNGFGGLQSIGNNTFSGSILVSNTSSLGANAGSEMVISGPIQGYNSQNSTTTNNIPANLANTPANAQLIKVGAGTVTLTNSNQNLTLPVAIQEGTLLLQGSNAGLGNRSSQGLVSVSTSVAANAATLALDGGVSVSSRTLSLGGLGVASAGALRSISGNNTWAGNINLSATTSQAYVGVDSDVLILSGRIDGGSSTLYKTGAGSLVISGSGNRQGSTIVGAGVLFQNGSDSVPIYVNSGGTLSGTGTGGLLRINSGQSGVVNPGTQASGTAGILNVKGILAQSSSGVFEFDLLNQNLNGSTAQAGSSNDQLNVTGTVNLSGSPILTVNLAANFQPTARNVTYTIINNDGVDPVIGTFSGQAEGSLITVNNISYRISYVGGDGNDVTLTCVGVLTSSVLTSNDVDNLSRYGQPVTFTSVVSVPSGYSGNPTGSVQFFDQGVSIGSVPLNAGSASITISTLNVNGSPHIITAIFNGGSSIFAESTSNLISHTVNKANTSVSVTSPEIVYGTDLPLNLEASVATETLGGTVTGQVIFRINGVVQPLKTVDPTNGKAILNYTFTTAGFYSIDALYLGDSNLNGSSFSPSITQTILPTLQTTIGLMSSKNPADRLDNIAFTASIQDLNGNPVLFGIDKVQFLDSQAVIGTSDVTGGISTFATSSLPSGRRNITAKYLGDVDSTGSYYYSPSQSAVLHQAIQATSNLIVTGTNTGGGPQVNVYDQQNGLLKSFFAFAPEFTGGVRVASGDVTGDSIADVVVAAGPGGGPQVNVYDGANNFNLIRSFYAYDPSFPDGIYVAVGDVNGDGFGDIITGAGAGGGPHVQVFSGANYSNIASFFAFEPTFTGGVSVAGGDVNGDGYVDVVIGAGPGGGPRVLAFSGEQLAQSGSLVALANFWAFDVGVNRGVFVAAGDYNGDIVSDIVVAAGPGGGPHVKVFNGSGTNLIDNFFAYDINFAGGVVVALADIENDGQAEIVTGPFTNGGPDVRVFKYLQGIEYYFWAYDPNYNAGIYVG